MTFRIDRISKSGKLWFFNFKGVDGKGVYGQFFSPGRGLY